MTIDRTTPRRRAKLLGHANYKGKICRHCETDVRYTSNGACVACVQRDTRNQRMRDRSARLRTADLPQKNSSARTRAVAKGYDRYKGRTCPQCSTRERDVVTGKCLVCAKAGVTYYSRVVQKTPRDPRIRLLASAKSRAQAKGRDFNIDLEDIIIPEICPVLGIPMTSPSLDRKNNDLGYVKGNVFVISKRANVLKNDANIAEIRAILAYMLT